MINCKRVVNIRDEPYSITCDKCGKTFIIGENDLEIQEFQHISFCGGYGSVFGDMNDVECDICQHCLKAMIGDIVRVNE